MLVEASAVLTPAFAVGCVSSCRCYQSEIRSELIGVDSDHVFRV